MKVLIDFQSFDRDASIALLRSLYIECARIFDKENVAWIFEHNSTPGYLMGWIDRFLPDCDHVIFMNDYSFLANDQTILISNDARRKRLFESKEGRAKSISSLDDIRTFSHLTRAERDANLW